MQNIFQRIESLIGKENLVKLNNSHVAIFGIGGVGGYVAESLARSGIGKITLIDNDTINETNINRQIVALNSTIGKLKTTIMKNRLLDINPNCMIYEYPIFFNYANSSIINFSDFSYIADAIDSVQSKLLLIQIAKENNIPIISSMGTGNKLDATKLSITNISKTHTCPLAKKIRKELGLIGIKDLKVVFSSEQPLNSNIYNDNNKLVPSSIITVPAVAGLLMANEIICDILNIEK